MEQVGLFDTSTLRPYTIPLKCRGEKKIEVFGESLSRVTTMMISVIAITVLLGILVKVTSSTHRRVRWVKNCALPTLGGLSVAAAIYGGSYLMHAVKVAPKNFQAMTNSMLLNANKLGNIDVTHMLYNWTGNGKWQAIMQFNGSQLLLGSLPLNTSSQSCCPFTQSFICSLAPVTQNDTQALQKANQQATQVGAVGIILLVSGIATIFTVLLLREKRSVQTQTETTLLLDPSPNL